MTRRIPWFGILIVIFLAACVGTYLSVASAEGQQTNASEAPCPDTGQDGYDLDPCPEPGLIPPTSIVNGCPEAPCPPGYPGDPTEPVPFDDGDPAYPLTPPASVPEAQPAAPISGSPSFAG